MFVSREHSTESDFPINDQSTHEELSFPRLQFARSCDLRISSTHFFFLEEGIVFEGTTGVYERICRFDSK